MDSWLAIQPEPTGFAILESGFSGWRSLMEISLNAQVEYTDGLVWHPVGRSISVLINPIIDQVTHVVVKETESPQTEYLVPVELVAETTAETIRLNCNKTELEQLAPFIKTTFIEKTIPAGILGSGGGMSGMGTYYYLPYVTPEITVQVPVEHPQIPPGELAVGRGARVEATDGPVGKVDEFVVNPENGQITHLVMREGHLWGKREVIIHISAIAEIREGTVFLNLDQHQVEILPTLSVHRSWS
jgi:sporulation protein YlmC with PRC-barrel domain